MRRFGLFLVLFMFVGTFIFAQTHVSVPLDHHVYNILDQAQSRGLLSPLPAVKPYTRGRVLSALNEILAAEARRFGGLSQAERRILLDLREEFTLREAGFDPWSGVYRFEGESDVRFSMDIGIYGESLNSGAYYVEDKNSYLGTDTWGTFYLNGDVGENFSFGVDFSAGFMRAQRRLLGTYDTYATEMNEPLDSKNVNRRVNVYSQPLAFFPYTYQRRWDGFMFSIGNISAGGMETWPESLFIAAAMLGEVSGSVFRDMLLLRAGRFQREWSGMMTGSSLVFNAAARPFVAMEATFNPVPWFSFSSITGVLEFDNHDGISIPALTFQNAFSLQQLEFNYQNYLHVSFGSSAIWAKRFELGYIFPLIDNFFYQNFIGNHDNMAIHLNILGRYPGLGSAWFSFFVDEIEASSVSSLFEQDRHMFAYQTGLQLIIPNLPFASVSLSYTKIEPYNYTHEREYLPWYDRANGPMEQAYVNSGVSLGHYLPPNSDEVKFRFDIRPMQRTSAHWQYQLIRHGANFGHTQVPGSSLVSELDPADRGNKESLRKNFLEDGTYRWLHIIKIGAEHRFGNLPLTIFGEAGVAYSYFTHVSNDVYNRYNPGSRPQMLDGREILGEYRTLTAYIFTLGFRVFK